MEMKLNATLADWKNATIHRSIRVNFVLVVLYALLGELAKRDADAIGMHAATFFLIICTSRLNPGDPKWEVYYQSRFFRKAERWLLLPITIFWSLVFAGAVVLYAYTKLAA